MSNDSELTYAFQMAEWRVERANNHIDHLKKIIEWTVHPDNYLAIPDHNPQTGNYVLKVGPKNGGLPRHLPIVAGEVAHALSITLDYLWSGITRYVAPSFAKRAHFPDHETLTNLQDMVSKDAAVKAMPALEKFIIEEIRPYKDGNFLLWAVGKLDNVDKHRLLLASMAIAKLGKFVATSEDGSVIDLSYSTINTYGPELILGFAAPFKLNDDTEISVDIVFNEPDVLPPGNPVLQTMIDLSNALAETVEAFKHKLL